MLRIFTRAKLFNFLLMILFMCACSDKQSMQTPSPKITIAGFDLRDYLGNPVGHVGAEDSDWLFADSLSKDELHLFDFNTPYSLNNTSVDVYGQVFFAYPNPCKDYIRFNFAGQDSTVFRIVIVDSNLTVLKQLSLKDVYVVIGVDVSDRTLFPVGCSRRIYYSLSAKDNLNYRFGYGDIKICAANNVSEYSLCF